MNFIKNYKKLNVVIKASIWFTLVNIIDKGIAVLTQPFINRILSTEEVGTYGVYSSWYSIISILVTFNLFCGVLEVYITKEKANENTIVGSLNILSFIISLVYFVLFSFFILPISNLLRLRPLYLILMLVIIIGDTMIQFWAVPKRFNYSYKVYAVIIVGLFFVKSVLSVLLAYYTKSDRVLGRLLGICIPTLLCGLVLFYRTISKTDFKGVIKYWWPAIKFNLPLIPHYLSSVILASSDRIMIERMSSLNNAGYYSVAYSFSGLCLIVFNAINAAYNPYCLNALKEKKYEKITQSTIIIFLFSMMFSLLMIYLAPEGLMLLGSKKYLDALPIIPILIVGIFFSSFYFVFSNVEFYYEKTKGIFPITLFGALLNVGLNYWLIPIWGYFAAAYTTLICYLIIACAHCVISRKIIGEDIFNLKIIVISLIVFVLFALSALYLYKLHIFVRYIVILVLLICSCFFLIKNKTILLGFTKKTSVGNDAEK